MANTLSVMTNVLRNVVSKKRRRYKENGFNLDLAYICDNIIAMGYPAEKYESMYRNRLEDVRNFLEENHRDHYKIYNLCLERNYDVQKFHGRVSVYPFEDHNPPTIELIQKFCEDVDTWLKAECHNVAAVHCKAGKGRTGTMICCYLLYSGQKGTADEALAWYDEKRTKDRKGVTIPSQRRYVQYFSNLMCLGLPYERRTVQFREIRFSEAHLLHNQGSVHCLISVLQDTSSAVKVQQLQNLSIDFRKTHILHIKNPTLLVTGDIKVELIKNNKKIFHFWFNTFFVRDMAVTEGDGQDLKLVYTLRKWEIDDAHKDKENKCFSEDFKVDVVFSAEDSERNRMLNVADNMNSNRSISSHQLISKESRLPTPSGTYLFPQNNSSSSTSLICDKDSSNPASANSKLVRAKIESILVGNAGDNGLSTFNDGISIIMPRQQYSSQYKSTGNINCSGGSLPSQPVMDKASLIKCAGKQAANQNTFYKKTLEQVQNSIKRQPMVSSPSNERHINHQKVQSNVDVGRHSSEEGVEGDKIIRTTTSSFVEKPKHRPSGSYNYYSSNSSNAMNYNCANNYNCTNNRNSKSSSLSSQSSLSAVLDNDEDWESANGNFKNVTSSSSLDSSTPGKNLKVHASNISTVHRQSPSSTSSSSLLYMKNIHKELSRTMFSGRTICDQKCDKATNDNCRSNVSPLTRSSGVAKTTQACHCCLLQTDDKCSKFK